MSRDDAILSANERLTDALAAALLEAAEDEVLASHTPAGAKVAADALRQRLRRASSDASGRSVATTPSSPIPESSASGR